ncbi:MAG: hypothetical protein HFG82_12260 [Dorea sp.]|jgi:hypothetical protein|nr:hypothetical protein [Dorea sp.]
MSKINAIRMINVNYNNNAIRISDECFHLNGESTLLSLRNGGGKSVLVQLVTALFVHKRYRDAKDRPFESYFTTNRPSFILVEWALDRGTGCVLTGMMVRRSQAVGEENGEKLEMVNIISEYREPCVQDIHHLPVVEKGKKEIVLKNFAACRQMFESYKKDRAMCFFYYDMNNPAQSRQYFDKLMEYQIHYKEWETIIKKVNLKESGLSDLFSDCRDEKGLVEKWFLEAVESKLNKERNRMKEFQVILEKYVGQYKDNQTKIKRRDIIRAFKEEGDKIRKKTEEYQVKSCQAGNQENLIANFIGELVRLHEEAEEEYQRLLEKIASIRGQLARVEYEKLSSDIHKLRDELRFHLSNRNMIEIEKEELEQEAARRQRALKLLACAKQQKVTYQERKELEVLRQKLILSRQKEEKLEPEIKYLGYTLRRYYEGLLDENESRKRENEEAAVKAKAKLERVEKKLSELAESFLQNASREGGLKSAAASYDRTEEEYNRRYEETLVRNILGMYEPGALEICREAYVKEQKTAARSLLTLRREQEKANEKSRSLERKLQDIRSGLVQGKLELRQQEDVRKKYEQELEARKVVQRYLNLEEAEPFDRQKILHRSERKLQEIGEIRRKLEKEEDVLQKEYQRLTQGKALELPEEIAQELENLGLHVVYGMEWLSKNGYCEEENLELVRCHPFLPYALILSEAELHKLSRNMGGIYTSFPIPIVVRERLERGEKDRKCGIVRLEGVSFYVWFNENLLNEEKLKALVQEKERQIGKKREAISIRQAEYTEYFERQELIRNQEVSKERWDANEKQCRELGERIEKLSKECGASEEELAEIRTQLEKQERDIRRADRTAEYQQRRLEDFERLCREYEAYEQNLREMERCKKEADKLSEKQKLFRNLQEKLRMQQKTQELERMRLFQRGEELWKEERKYKAYEKAEATGGWKRTSMDESDNMREMEARYAAITSRMSQEIQELEEQEQRAESRYQEALEELKYLQRKYGLSDEEWKEVSYNREEESHQEIMLEDLNRRISVKQRLWNDEDKQIAVVNQKKSERAERMKKECGEEEPLPKEEIQKQDFDARKNQFRYQENESLKQADIWKEKLRSYDENLTALSEYNDFPFGEKVVWEQDFSKLDAKSLRNFKGILIRDYNQMLRERREAQDALTRLLNQIVRMEQFQEDFYKKPLEAMLELTDDAFAVWKQLNTTIQSYDSLMEKLEVDISLVEKEKNKIVELLEDYLREVHQNLGKMDNNSTIVIRERPVKMLKIGLPKWEENEKLYQLRLQDMIAHITQKGLKLFEQNENAQEYFGTQITTRNLYDTVVGIGNVQIRLYKIEAQREYPITWAEVASNSGGEGFLSAFVLLSSLLYYMRKDDTDLFADKNEGKVLIMDNPFAQTNASHLLKPLMDMAKKMNTQLVCLTGLGGESIYNRFDNIYVLNLIAANLRGGMQYLKAEHLRGNEQETLIVSRIEVLKQQELVF